MHNTHTMYILSMVYTLCKQSWHNEDNCKWNVFKEGSISVFKHKDKQTKCIALYVNFMIFLTILLTKNLGQYDKPRVLGCK